MRNGKRIDVSVDWLPTDIGSPTAYMCHTEIASQDLNRYSFKVTLPAEQTVLKFELAVSRWEFVIVLTLVIVLTCSVAG